MKNRVVQKENPLLGVQSSRYNRNIDLQLTVLGVYLKLCVIAGDEDSRQIVWMNLTSGSPQRCDCGHYFQLVKGNPIDIDMSTK